MATKIIAPHGVKKQIQRVFGYSQPTIRRAFNGCDDTYAAKRIRYYALLHGGAEYERKTSPNPSFKGGESRTATATKTTSKV